MKIRVLAESKRVLVTLSLMAAIIIAVVCGVLSKCNNEDEQVGALSETEVTNVNRLGGQMKRVGEEKGRSHAQLSEVQLRPFDPNHADSATLISLGLSEWQVKCMMAYRRKGGRWRSPDDFSRLYGLSDAEFKRLRPYVRIAETDRRSRYVPYNRDDYGTPKIEKKVYERAEKLAEGTKISLNTADTTLLKKIPGIGSYKASKIVRYREKLGGFVSVRQLDEIEDMPAGLSRWFDEDLHETKVRKLPINKATFKELVRHPYLGYERTKIIVKHIRQYGPIRSWKDLRLYKEFGERDIERLTPYVVF